MLHFFFFFMYISYCPYLFMQFASKLVMCELLHFFKCIFVIAVLIYAIYL